MSVLFNTPLLGAGDDGYQIQRSVRFRRSASASFTRTPSAASNRKTWTWSCWVKRADLSNWQALFMQGVNGTTEGKIQFEDAGTGLRMRWEDYVSGTYNVALYTTQVFRDVGGWYHIVAALDTTQATASNRAKLYVNGVQVTAFNTATYPAQNYDGVVNNGQGFNIGNAGSNYLDGYMADVHFIDGQALTPSSFGETDTVTGAWKPKQYAGTYGTNGFYLNFSDNSAATAAAIGKDSSGNGNNWTPNNISVTSGSTYDSMLDVPTMWADGGNGRGNYCTWNPLDSRNTTASNGNLLLTNSTVACRGRGTMGVSSGKWYFEYTITTYASGGEIGLDTITTTNNSNYVGGDATSWGYGTNSGNKVNNGTSSAYGSSVTTGDVVMVAFDMDAGKLWFGKNGIWAASGDPAAGTNAAFTNLTGSLTPAIGTGGGSAQAITLNCGQRPFAYTPPSGFKALHTGNLPEPTIKKGNAYFDVLTWTGDNTSSRTLTGLGFQPDFVWAKRRSSAASHVLFDAVRGFGSNKELQTDNTGAEGAGDTANFGYISAATSSGFTMIRGAVDSGYLNNTGNTHVAWNWKEGATPGFDIVTYTGTGSAGLTVNHSLGVAPRMIIVKGRGNVNNWSVYHASLGNAQTVYLNLTQAASSGSTTSWNSTTPSSTTFTVGPDNAVNQSGISFVAYLFSAVSGFSAFGNYTGNGSSDGPFVFCGFRPRFLLYKRSSSTGGNWHIMDTTRETENTMDQTLFPNLSNAETTASSLNIDLLSNGFKLRNNDQDRNNNGDTYIYAAFAENPFKYALAR